MKKIYLTRKQHKSWSLDNPIGDPTGGTAYGERRDPITALVAGGAGLVGSVLSSNAASSAADEQANAASQSNQTQLAMYNQTRDDQTPYRNAGYTALAQLSAGTQAGGQFTHTFDANDLTNGLSPNYQFQLSQGEGAVNNQNSVTGGLVGGNALKGISDYAQNSASSAYQQAFDNYNTNQTNIYNRLSSIAGLGQTSLGTTASTGTSTANAVSSGTLASGAAQAAGTVGSANAISGGLSNAASMYSLSNLLNG